MPSFLLVMPVLFPALSALLLYLLPIKNARLLKTLYMAATVLTSLFVFALCLFPTERLELLDFGKELGVSLCLAFSLDGVGRFFALLVAALWPFALLYAFGYMAKDGRQPVFYFFYLLSFASTCGVAFSANLMTLYVFYEMLTLCTVPLVLHGYTRAHRKATFRYAACTVGGAAFGFFGLVCVLYMTGSTEFTLGGLFGGAPSVLTGIMFLVCFFGFGVKAAIWPFSYWLPTASVAPTPVTALLHAVAVVKAGAFALLRVVYFVFGAETLSHTVYARIALGFSLVTVVYASAKALQSGHFKRRLAWSTVSNLSYIAAGVMLCSEAGMYAALFHILAHALTKMCSFLCAGNFMNVTGKERLSDLYGIGRRMPVTFGCFTLAACSLVGVPPFIGFFSKWELLRAAAGEGLWGYLTVAALLFSAALTAIYMFTVVLRAFFPDRAKDRYPSPDADSIHEADLRMLVPVCLFALLTLAAGICARPVFDLIVGL